MHTPESKAEATRRLQSPSFFRNHVHRTLDAMRALEMLQGTNLADRSALSVVLLLLGVERSSSKNAPEPCLILNKRSSKVRQPGDICCPGGGIEPHIDALLARLLRLPGSPLRRWHHYAQWQLEHPRALYHLQLLLATALREGLEEMRLNPLAVGFLGCLPPEPLVMFRRVIHPLVVWGGWQRHYYPNWEVERVVNIPVRQLLNPERYICYRLSMPASPADDTNSGRRDFPAFRFATPDGVEILWGATFRIAMGFLKIVLDFSPPKIETLKVVERELPPRYMTGTG